MMRTFLLVIFCSCALGAIVPQAVPVTLSVPGALEPVRAAGHMAVVYELHVANTGSKSLRLEHLEVHNAAAPTANPIASYGKAELERNTKLIAPRGSPAPKVLDPGVRAVVFLWLDFASADVIPRALVHHVVFADRSTADGAQVPVR